MVTNTQALTALEQLVPSNVDEIAHETGFIRRGRTVTGRGFVLTLVGTWLSTPGASLSQLCQVSEGMGMSLCPQSLADRFTASAAEFLRRVVTKAITQAVCAKTVAADLLARFQQGVWVYDSTVIALHRSHAAQWPGCGGNRGENAAMKVQVALNLATGELSELEVVPGRQQDRACPPAPRAGALRLAAMGYFSLANLRAWSTVDGAWVVRPTAQTHVTSEDGYSGPLSGLLRRRGATAVDEWIQLGKRRRLRCRLVAVLVPAAVAAQRRQRLEQAAYEKREPVSAERIAQCDWWSFCTNLPVERLSVQEGLLLLRARWQIELLFKLWKSEGQLDTSRSAQPYRQLCECYAKLLACVVQHWLTQAACWSALDRSLVKAAKAIRLHGLHLIQTLATGTPRDLREALATVIQVIQGCCRVNRSRKHPRFAHLVLGLPTDTGLPNPPDHPPAPALAPLNTPIPDLVPA